MKLTADRKDYVNVRLDRIKVAEALGIAYETKTGQPIPPFYADYVDWVYFTVQFARALGISEEQISVLLADLGAG